MAHGGTLYTRAVSAGNALLIGIVTAPPRTACRGPVHAMAPDATALRCARRRSGHIRARSTAPQALTALRSAAARSHRRNPAPHQSDRLGSPKRPAQDAAPPAKRPARLAAHREANRAARRRDAVVWADCRAEARRTGDGGKGPPRPPAQVASRGPQAERGGPGRQRRQALGDPRAR